MRRLRLFFPVFLVFALGLSAANSQQNGRPQDLPREPLVVQTAAGEHAFEVQIAKSDEQKRIGLMFRRSLPENEGMLFVYRYPEVVGIWMRNTYIPLDILFIRADGTIANIAYNAAPLSLDTMTSAGSVTGVLEINGGLAEKLGINPGDRVIHPAFKSGAES